MKFCITSCNYEPDFGLRLWLTLGAIVLYVQNMCLIVRRQFIVAYVVNGYILNAQY